MSACLEARLPGIAVDEDSMQFILSRSPLSGEADLGRRSHSFVPHLLIPAVATTISMGRAGVVYVQLGLAPQ